MPNPNSEETGLTPTEIQIAIALATLNSRKLVDPNSQTVFVGSEPVIVNSPEAELVTLINPGPDPIVLGGVQPVPIGPRPDPVGPLTGRSANLLHTGAPASVQVGGEELAMSFGRVGPGEYTLEASPLLQMPQRG
jgi:hypothetical protein